MAAGEQKAAERDAAGIILRRPVLPHRATGVASADYLTGGGVEQDRREVRSGPEVQHAAPCVQAAGDRVERLAADRLTAQPVVLDELHDRGLVGEVVADVVAPRVRRDDHQREARAVAAPVRVLPSATGACADRRVSGGVRAVDDRRHLVVIPAVGVVVGDDDRRGLPVLRLLDLVDRVDDEVLLVERVGVAGVGVLVLGRLEVAHRRHVAVLERGVEVRQVVLVVGLVGLADRRLRGRRQVLGVGRGLVVLERVVVR